MISSDESYIVQNDENTLCFEWWLIGYFGARGSDQM